MQGKDATSPNTAYTALHIEKCKMHKCKKEQNPFGEI